MKLKIFVVILSFIIFGCTSIPEKERESVRENLDFEAKTTVEQLISNNLSAKEDKVSSVGYFIAKITSAQLAIVGGGIGRGVLYSKKEDSSLYMDVKRADLGPGLSTSSYYVILFFQNDSAFENFKKSKRYKAIGAETAIGTQSLSSVSGLEEDVSVYFVGGAGAAITLTARLIRVAINTELSDTGISDVYIPNKQLKRESKSNPPQWNRKLPFLAQQVIDQGYELPLPYGVSGLYGVVEQDMILENLSVGINGKEEEPFKFVSFKDASSKNDTFQLKLDTWLFPFMNVYALLGKIDGTASMDIYLDGDQMLEHIEADCSGIIKPPSCNLLGGKEFLLEIDTGFSGKTYGVGTILAGGWNDWFVTLPFSFTYADMDNTNTDGIAITFTPRFGYIFDVGKLGNLALFAGGNYLETDLTISSTVGVEDLLTLDYTIDQANSDKWNYVFGGNLDISKNLGIHFEYNGIYGSRSSWVTSITYRY